MQIKLKNYHHFNNKNKRIVSSTDKDLKEIILDENKLTNIFSLNLPTLINSLNNNYILNSSSYCNLVVNFEDFTILNKFLLNQKNYFKRKLNKWFKTDFNTNSDYAFYSKDEKIIHIREELFNSQNQYYHPTFSQILKSQLSSSDFLNFVILHEIGHAVHHEYYLNTHKNLFSNIQDCEYINKTTSFYGYVGLIGNANQLNVEFRNKDLNMMIFHAISEGFADLYSCISIGELYPKNQAIDLINNIILSRKEADKGGEFYYSYPSIEKYLDDLKNDHIPFNDFNSMYNYISSTINQTVFNLINKQFKKTDSEENILNSRFLGVICKQLDLNSNNISKTIEILNYQYGLNISSLSLSENEFQNGKRLYENNKHLFNSDLNLPTSKSKMQQLRQFFSNNKSSKKIDL